MTTKTTKTAKTTKTNITGKELAALATILGSEYIEDSGRTGAENIGYGVWTDVVLRAFDDKAETAAAVVKVLVKNGYVTLSDSEALGDVIAVTDAGFNAVLNAARRGVLIGAYKGLAEIPLCISEALSLESAASIEGAPSNAANADLTDAAPAPAPVEQAPASDLTLKDAGAVTVRIIPGAPSTVTMTHTTPAAPEQVASAVPEAPVVEAPADAGLDAAPQAAQPDAAAPLTAEQKKLARRAARKATRAARKAKKAAQAGANSAIAQAAAIVANDDGVASVFQTALFAAFSALGEATRRMDEAQAEHVAAGEKFAAAAAALAEAKARIDAALETTLTGAKNDTAAQAA